MNFKNFALGILCVLGISSGQILFKLAARHIDLLGAERSLAKLFTNYHLIIGLFVYVITTFLWLALLRVVDLKEAYPLMALAFIFVPFFARIFLGEKIELNTYLGGMFIIIGIVVSSR